MMREKLENKISNTDFSLIGTREWKIPARVIRYLDIKI